MLISFYRSLSTWFPWWNYYWTELLIVFALFLSSSFLFPFHFDFYFFWNPFFILLKLLFVWLKTTLLILRWFIFQENLFLWQIILPLNILFLNNLFWNCLVKVMALENKICHLLLYEQLNSSRINEINVVFGLLIFFCFLFLTKNLYLLLNFVIRTCLRFVLSIFPDLILRKFLHTYWL